MDPIFEKIEKIEALIEGAKSEGEKLAAIEARRRLNDKRKDEEVEYSIRTQDMWHKKLFMALCRKYKLEPYRYYRQKYTTVMVRVSKNLLDNVLWREYLEYSDKLRSLIDDITTEIISKIHKDEEERVIMGDIEHKK